MGQSLDQGFCLKVSCKQTKVIFDFVVTHQSERRVHPLGAEFVSLVIKYLQSQF